jgi:dienelactone hydrolase
VGRILYDWVDEQTLDTLAPVQGTKRELLVWVWYPAAVSSGPVRDSYLPECWQSAAEAVGTPPIFKLLTRDLSKVHGHCYREPELLSEHPSYPVVIMRGGASSDVLNYSTLAEDLASHGYVVVGFDAPYRTRVVVFPDGRVIYRTPENNPELYSGEELTRCAEKLLAAWTSDCMFVLDRLEHLNASDSSGKFRGRLDMSRVGAFGHSFGGATAAQLCAQEPRCKAGVDIDGSLHGTVIQKGIHTQFLFLLSDHGDLSASAESRRIMGDIQSVYERLPPDGRLRITVRGANHFMFSDDGAVLKSGILRGALRLVGVLGMDGRRQLAVTAHCLHSFFDAHLKKDGTSAKIALQEYPEIEIGE